MTRRDSHRFLIAYDIPDDRRRHTISVILKGFGHRVQYSVFMIDCSPGKIPILQHELEENMKPGEVSVLLCDLGPSKLVDSRVITHLGSSRYTMIPGAMII